MLFTHWRHDPQNPKSICSNTILTAMVDRNGNVWAGTYSQGVDRLDRKTGFFDHFHDDLSNPRGLSHGLVTSIIQDRKGNIWLGTGGGLNLYHEETGDFTRFFVEDGLPNDNIYGILEDDLGKLWMSTNYGLSRLDPETRQFRNYDVNDGLQGNEFNQFSFFRAKSGEMFFGGVNGLTSFFHPGSQKKQKRPP